MKKSVCASPSRKESQWGLVYLVFQLLALPSLLAFVNESAGLSDSELNFIFFLLNFLAILWIFHDFLGASALQMTRHPIQFAEAVILGYVAFWACTRGVEWVIRLLSPGYANANDASIAAMSRNGYFLMAVGTVILVPPVEECLYRGVIFRGLLKVNPWCAYIVSTLAFALIHVIGFVGVYSPLELCLAVLQYVPAGVCLAWAYVRADTIFAPIVIHAIVNALGISNMR